MAEIGRALNLKYNIPEYPKSKEIESLISNYSQTIDSLRKENADLLSQIHKKDQIINSLTIEFEPSRRELLLKISMLCEKLENSLGDNYSSWLNGVEISRIRARINEETIINLEETLKSYKDRIVTQNLSLAENQKPIPDPLAQNNIPPDDYPVKDSKKHLINTINQGTVKTYLASLSTKLLEFEKLIKIFNEALRPKDPVAQSELEGISKIKSLSTEMFGSENFSIANSFSLLESLTESVLDSFYTSLAEIPEPVPALEDLRALDELLKSSNFTVEVLAKAFGVEDKYKELVEARVIPELDVELERNFSTRWNWTQKYIERVSIVGLELEAVKRSIIDKDEGTLKLNKVSKKLLRNCYKAEKSLASLAQSLPEEEFGKTKKNLEKISKKRVEKLRNSRMSDNPLRQGENIEELVELQSDFNRALNDAIEDLTKRPVADYDENEFHGFDYTGLARGEKIENFKTSGQDPGQIDMLTEKLNKFALENNKLTSKLAKKNSKNKETQENLRTFTSKNSELEETIKKLSKKISELEKQLASDEKEKKNLEDQIDSLCKERKKLEDQSLKTSIKSIEDDEKLKKTLEKNFDLEDEFTKTVEEKKDLESQLEKSNQLNTDLKSQIDQMQDSNKDHQSLLEKISHKIGTILVKTDFVGDTLMELLPEEVLKEKMDKYQEEFEEIISKMNLSKTLSPENILKLLELLDLYEEANGIQASRLSGVSQKFAEDDLKHLTQSSKIVPSMKHKTNLRSSRPATVSPMALMKNSLEKVKDVSDETLKILEIEGQKQPKIKSESEEGYYEEITETVYYISTRLRSLQTALIVIERERENFLFQELDSYIAMADFKMSEEFKAIRENLKREVVDDHDSINVVLSKARLKFHLEKEVNKIRLEAGFKVEKIVTFKGIEENCYEVVKMLSDNIKLLGPSEEQFSEIKGKISEAYFAGSAEISSPEQVEVYIKTVKDMLVAQQKLLDSSNLSSQIAEVFGKSQEIVKKSAVNIEKLWVLLLKYSGTDSDKNFAKSLIVSVPDLGPELTENIKSFSQSTVSFAELVLKSEKKLLQYAESHEELISFNAELEDKLDDILRKNLRDLAGAEDEALKKRIHSLKDHFEAVDKAVYPTLKEKLEHLDECITIFGKIEDIKKTLASNLQKTIKKHENDIVNKTNEINSLKSESEAEKLSLKNRLEIAEKNFKEIKLRFDKLSEEVLTKDIEITSLNNNSRDLKQKIEDLENEIVRLQDEISDKNASIRASRVNLKEKNDEISRLEDRIREISENKSS